MKTSYTPLPRTPFTVRLYSEKSEPAFAVGLIAMQAPFCYSHAFGFTVRIKDGDLIELCEFAQLLKTHKGSATNGEGTILPDDALIDPAEFTFQARKSSTVTERESANAISLGARVTEHGTG